MEIGYYIYLLNKFEKKCFLLLASEYNPLDPKRETKMVICRNLQLKY